MPQMTVKATESHRMLPVGQYTDALTGEEWELYQCGQCAEEWKIRWKPWKRVKLERGAGTLTEEDADKIVALCKQGPAGQAKASAIMAGAPGHALVRTPTEDDLREWATQQGRLPEFEVMVKQCATEGKPLLRFSMAGATSETWTKAAGPYK